MTSDQILQYLYTTNLCLLAETCFWILLAYLEWDSQLKFCVEDFYKCVLWEPVIIPCSACSPVFSDYQYLRFLLSDFRQVLYWFYRFFLGISTECRWWFCNIRIDKILPMGGGNFDKYWCHFIIFTWSCPMNVAYTVPWHIPSQ